MEEIKNILNTFDVITLSEMDAVKLMDRTDTKFVFNRIELSDILNQLQPFYKVLEVNGNKVSKYESLYFDTPKFEMYHKHQSGKLNRHKVRFRKYVESNLKFFEVKFKNNKGRTIKTRVKQDQIDNIIQHQAQELLIKKTTHTSENLEPKIWVNYTRITLVNKNSPERVTIDLNLHFVKDHQVKNIDNLIIAEVKQDKSSSSPFLKLMKKLHIRQGSVSKYCFGVITFFDNIKHNNFKPKLISIKKITHDTIRNR
ncbi:MAG: polyphosphate polymerase domain-containing protein [Bacteroidetes bacterium]|nr:polyphosphate polymerase domain-containing protein [Bacteroidota bacterium]